MADPMIVAELLGASAVVSSIVEAVRSAPEPPDAQARAPDIPSRSVTGGIGSARWDTIRREIHRTATLAGDSDLDSRATQTEKEGVPP